MTMAVRLIDAPVGLFEADGVLVMKTKYITRHDDGTITPDCYIVESGEYFWGGAKTIEERNNLEVVPVDMSAIIRRWISMKERLPEWQDDVLVHYDGGRIDISWVDSLGDFSYQNLYGRVTHWMPLPAPPDHFRDITKKVHDNAKDALTITEVCPHCNNEITMVWSIIDDGYKAFCPICGERLMLCDACQHGCPSFVCDYNSEMDTCRHNLSDRRPPEREA